jgi:putative ABC transport system substrate-binding protein
VRAQQAPAQPGEGARRIGVLGGPSADDPEAHARQAALRQGLQELGWIEGRNIWFEYRARSDGDSEHMRRNAAELVALRPDAIVVTGGLNVAALQQLTRTIPIVFVGLVDPVGAGFVEGLARPGGNITGFTAFEYGLSVKWVELLKEIAPSLRRAGVMREQSAATGIGLWAAMQGAAPSLGLELKPVGIRNAVDIERAVAAFAREPGSGLIVTVSGPSIIRRALISELAARHRLPAVYPFRYFVTDGGLASYGPDFNDQLRRAAGYVDRILKGESPADLPVQHPTKFELVINLKVAKALGLELPSTLLARADEVIE